ncbi:putative ATP-dependent RNA helicase DDX59 [Gossypium arboreum]|uniref:Putative ATP-dependent RNA helicase DDX59 n=1 Tax=Gossypium arboreum TaxID=29729 RepID=A0A0B0NJE4_GOSAR|nr:putative ATP-dependent RNA helicase DDX59 [Gossypium arboreum]
MMPCPRQVLHWLSYIEVDAMSQTGLTLALINRCRCHVLGRSYTDTQQADTMSYTGLTLACISRGQCISQTCLTLALISMLIHVPYMSYTGTHDMADACPRHVLHWLTYHPMSWYEYPSLFQMVNWKSLLH